MEAVAMKKILFLGTGGTIASTPGAEGMLPTLKTEDLIRVIPQLSDICEIQPKMIMNIDSSNVQPEDWVLIAENVFQKLDKVDGVVIAHGTDTMAYTASALSFMLQNLDKPVVLTGSQLSMTDDGTDAKRNIIDACVVACSGIAGVFIVFNGKIIKGCRSYKANTRDFQAFESLNYPYIGTIFNRKISFIHKPNVPLDKKPALNTKHSTAVFILKLFPGIDPKILDVLKDLNYRAVLIESFGAGGVPFLRRNLLPGIEALIKRGISIVVTTQCLLGGSDLTVYEVGQKALKLGVIPAYDMTTETLVTKVMWALGQTESREGLRKIMETNYADEVSLSS
jgi:L-asparaginase